MPKLLTKSVVILLLFACMACMYLPGQKADVATLQEKIRLNVIDSANLSFANFLGINGFEWDFFRKGTSDIDSSNFKVIQSFGEFRHYMDWEKIESVEGKYTFNPTHAGGFFYDKMYQICNQNNIEVLTCLQNSAPWLVATYPPDQQGVDNVPAQYGLNHYVAASYLSQAKTAFQFAARYGSNKNVDNTLVTVDGTPRWNTDPVNTVEIGLGYVRYIECNNEVDKTWKGAKAHQNPDEYAANLSAFYDGDMGKLGKGVGVKNADPSMKVVMAGIANPDTAYVIGIINWCKKHRGYKPDGSVNLCFDVINYHSYNNDGEPGKDYTVGRAPELCPAAKIADGFVAMAAKYAKGMDVWITESGYDVNQQSKQRAIPIGSKSASITQADWTLRSAFLYARHGLKKSFFYMMDDVDPNSATSYSSSGFVNGSTKRPVADYFLQTKKLLGAYSYQQTISSNPIVDIYINQGKKIYVMYVPDEVGRKASYELKLDNATSAKIHHLALGAKDIKTEAAPVNNGKIKLELTETPIFVERNN